MQTQSQQIQQLQTFFAKQFEASRHYVNAVIGTGYAGFFATWGFTRAHLSAEVELASALLVLLSLASFIGWEVWRNVENVLAFRKIGGLITEGPARQAPARLVEYGQKRQARDMKRLKSWGVSASISIITAALALLLLGVSFTVELWSTIGLEAL